MRSTRTPDESEAMRLVFDKLKSQGYNPIENSDITDRPDYVFNLDETTIAAECTNINIEKLLKWNNSKKHFKHDKHYEIKFALEPHYWIKFAITDKEPLIPIYVKNAAAQKAWLIVHSLEQPELFDCTDNIKLVIRDAVRYLDPKFDEVWFVHSQCGANRVWTKGDAKISHFPKWDNDITDYPYESIIQFTGVVTKNGLNKTVVFGDEQNISLEIKPFDRD